MIKVQVTRTKHGTKLVEIHTFANQNDMDRRVNLWQRIWEVEILILPTVCSPHLDMYKPWPQEKIDELHKVLKDVFGKPDV